MRWAEATGPLALLAAVLWVAHPLQTESVTYVVQRAESLVGLWFLATLYGFIRGSEAQEREGASTSARGWFAIAVATCAAGMATKEVMVTAPMMQQGVDVDLPETTTQPIRVQDEPLILTVEKDGKVHVGRREIPQAELKDKLVAIFEGRDSRELFLRADKAAPYGVVVQALAAAREAGATKLGMVTEPEK